MEKQKIGAPSKPEETHKKARAISLTDAEYSNLKTKAEAEKLGVSAYIIKKLKLK